MAIRLSIIIPCYNSSKTILRCLDSIYALPLPESDFEVIAVNDGSTDETQALLEEYVRHHTQLTVIRHLVNRNLGAARNTGLAAAKGKVIAFVDSDDEVSPGMIQALNLMEAKDLDMVALRLEYRERGRAQILSLPYSPDDVFSGIRLQEDHPFWSVSVWSYLYSRDIIKAVNYPFVEGAYYEDVDFVYNHLYRAERINYCDECCYHFIVSPASITQSFSSKHDFSSAFLGARLLSSFSKLDYIDSSFAKTMIEFGCIKLNKVFRQLFRLGSISEVKAFYNLLDSRIERNFLLKIKTPAYYWTFQTRFWLRHRLASTLFAGTVGSLKQFAFKTLWNEKKHAS